MRDIPVHRRNFGFMFQDYALFPHKDVRANVAFGLRMQRLPRAQIDARVAEMLALVGLQGYERRRVVELSGGEQQRVALARSLAPRPRLLMLDEPLGALDRTLREELMNELRGILKRVGMTALYVTHDQQEAFAVSDRVLIMRARPDAGRGGWIEQEGTPAEVYRRPASDYVARFLGFRNLIPGAVVSASGSGGYRVATPAGELTARDAGGPWAAGDKVTVLIRPEAASLCDGENAGPGSPTTTGSKGGWCRRRFAAATTWCKRYTRATSASSRRSPRRTRACPTSAASLVLRLDPDAITLLAPSALTNFRSTGI